MHYFWKVISALQVKHMQLYFKLGSAKSAFEGLFSISVIFLGLMVSVLDKFPDLSGIMMYYHVCLQLHEGCLEGCIGEGGAPCTRDPVCAAHSSCLMWVPGGKACWVATCRLE